MHSDNKNMGSSAAATFAGLPELLRCVADHIQSSKHLGTLRLVSKNFHDVATPVLFHAAAPISGANYEAGALAGLKELINRNLVGYVRSLTIRSATNWPLAANSGIQELLVKTPLLESFDCSCPKERGARGLSEGWDNSPKVVTLLVGFVDPKVPTGES